MRVKLNDFIKIYKAIWRMKLKRHNYTILKNKLKDMFVYDYEIKPVATRVIGAYSAMIPLVQMQFNNKAFYKNNNYFGKKMSEIRKLHKDIINDNDRHSKMYQLAHDNERLVRLKSQQLEQKFLNYEISNDEYKEKLFNYILSLKGGK